MLLFTNISPIIDHTEEKTKMPHKDDKIMDTYRELTTGLHKTGLAVHGIAVTQENHEKRIEALDQIVTTTDNSLQTRTTLLEDRIKRLENRTRNTDESRLAHATARIQSRSTMVAAWMGLAAGIVAAIITLIIAFK
jgi:hypothetical protein